MLTRSDCWEPLERRSFFYLQARRNEVRPKSGTGHCKVVTGYTRLEPAPVDRVIRAIRSAAAD